MTPSCKRIGGVLVLALFLFGGSGAFASAQPNDSDSLLAMGRSALDAGDPGIAVRLLKEAVVADPGNAEAYSYLGRAFQDQGALQPARKYYALALTVDPLEPNALNWSGQIDLAEGKTADAEAKLKRLERSCAGCPQTDELAGRMSALGGASNSKDYSKR